MTPSRHTIAEADLVERQIGRPPREPWRVAARCRFGHPTVIVSPSRLADGTPFPNFAWLTCPWLVDRAFELESAGEAAGWVARAAADADLRARLVAVDALVRELRQHESVDDDACAGVGVAGQRDPLGIKCIHAHVALALIGLDDPIGGAVLSEGSDCPDARCAALVPTEGADHG